MEWALAAILGVARAEVNLATERATVTGVGLSPASLIGAVQDAGYEAEMQTGDAERERAREAAEAGHTRHDLLQMVAAAVLTAPLLLPMAGVAPTRSESYRAEPRKGS